LTSTLSGFVNGENAGTAAGFSGAADATTTAGATTADGTAPITAGAGNLAATNYAFTRLVDGTLTINAAPRPSSPHRRLSLRRRDAATRYAVEAGQNCTGTTADQYSRTPSEHQAGRDQPVADAYGDAEFQF